MRWIQTSQKSCTEGFSPVFDGRHFLAQHRPPVATYYPCAEPSEADFQTGKCRVSFNPVKRMGMSESSFSECFFLFFNGRHFTFCHSLQCALNITLLVLQEQCSNCALWEEIIIPSLKCSHHQAVSQKASLQFVYDYISYFTICPNVIPNIPSQNTQRPTFKLRNVE